MTRAKKTKILYLENIGAHQEWVRNALLGDFDLSWAQSISEAKNKLQAERFDLFVMNLELTEGNTSNFFTELMENPQFETPVVFVSSETDKIRRAHGLNLGAHDFIAYPAEEMEFKARLNSILLRQARAERTKEFIRNGDLEFNLFNQKVFLKGMDLDLTPNEFKVLLYLNNHKGKIISRQELIDTVWGREVHVIRRTVDMHISKIRKKLDGSPYRIRPIPKIGYVFSDQIFEAMSS